MSLAYPPPSNSSRKKQAEHDALLLSNRIALLKKEELRAQKKVSATKQRAEDIIRLRKENDRKAQERTSAGEKQAREIKRQQAAHKEHEVQATANRASRVDGEMRRKMDGVAMVRKEKQVLRKDLVEQRQTTIEANQARRRGIKEADEKHKEERVRAARKQAAMNKKAYDSRVRAEEEEIREREREVKRMEQTEMKLIKTLRKTQIMQKNAFVVLEGALNNA